MDEQNNVLKEALHQNKLQSLWDAETTDEKVKGVLNKIAMVFTTAISTTLLQVTALLLMPLR